MRKFLTVIYQRVYLSLSYVYSLFDLLNDFKRNFQQKRTASEKRGEYSRHRIDTNGRSLP